MPNTFDEPPDTRGADDAERAIRNKAMQAALETLRGLFDGVVLLGTWTCEDGGTATSVYTAGNWYAQNGVAAHFLKKRNAQAGLEAADQHKPES